MGGRGSSSGMNSIRPLVPVKTLPKLEGTEKQVSWAISIRKDVLKGILNGFGWTPDGRPTTYMKYLFSAEKIRELFSEFNPDMKLIKHLQDSYKRYTELTQQTSAKFWIDNRTNGIGIQNAGNNKLYERVFGFTEKELRKRKNNW